MVLLDSKRDDFSNEQTPSKNCSGFYFDIVRPTLLGIKIIPNKEFGI